jgi:hypothetical protein
MQGGQLVFRDGAAFEQEPPDQGGLPVVDAAAGHEAQEGQK